MIKYWRRLVLIEVALIVLVLYSVFITYFCVKFGLTILRVQDSVEASLDKIDSQYATITEILNRPLFYDSPEIKTVMEGVSNTRDAILDVANTLSNNFEEGNLEIEG